MTCASIASVEYARNEWNSGGLGGGLRASQSRACQLRLMAAADSNGRCNTLRLLSRRSVADEVSNANLLHGRPEGIDVAALE